MGPIGTGDFENSEKVVYVLQNLAAQQVGVDLRYWGGKGTASRINNWNSKPVAPIVEDYNKLQPKNQTIANLLGIARTHLG